MVFGMALKVRRMVTLSWPHNVPMRAFRTWKQQDALAAISLKCGLKGNRGSNVTPSIFGILTVGTGMLIPVDFLVFHQLHAYKTRKIYVV